MKLSAKHTLHVQTEDYQDAKNEGHQAYPSLSRWWDLNWESFKSVCYLLFYYMSLAIEKIRKIRKIYEK